MNAVYLNRLGLVLGLISGLLLVPEIFNLIPLERMGESINKRLSSVERWSMLPIKLHPLSWKKTYSEDAREKSIEPLTAISGFVFSVIWIGTTTFGIISASNFFLFFGLLPPLYATVQKIIIFLQQGYFRKRIIPLTLVAFISVFILSPPVSLLRIVLLILHVIVSKGKKFFENHVALRNSLTILAILMFIASNILQIIATFVA